jgi:hypothetical protein
MFLLCSHYSKAIMYLTKQAPNLVSGRQADVPGITPAMIEAGVIALEEFSGSYEPGALVAEVYTAMADARSRQSETAGQKQ